MELALEVLGGKWRAVVLAEIKEGAQRYADLRRRIPQMSEKMLTQRLHELVEAGLIARRAGLYVLTPRGESGRFVLEALYAWGQVLAPELGARLEPAAPREEAKG